MDGDKKYYNTINDTKNKHANPVHSMTYGPRQKSSIYAVDNAEVMRDFHRAQTTKSAKRRSLMSAGCKNAEALNVKQQKQRRPCTTAYLGCDMINDRFLDKLFGRLTVGPAVNLHPFPML